MKYRAWKSQRHAYLTRDTATVLLTAARPFALAYSAPIRMQSMSATNTCTAPRDGRAMLVLSTTAATTTMTKTTPRRENVYMRTQKMPNRCDSLRE